MTQNTVPLPESVAYKSDDTELYVREEKFGIYDIPLYTADQMHTHAAKVCAEKDAEIAKLKSEDAALSNLLYWVERAVHKGNANSDIEDAYAEYESALKETK
jgi:hypothetical protein